MSRRALVAGFLVLSTSIAFSAPPGDPKSVSNEDGKYVDANGDPTYNVASDGTVDWYTFSGYRRYHADCHVCHGPDGLGSSYGPALVESVKRIGYPEFLEVVASGRKDVNTAKQNVMPAFGTNKNVMCYLDDIYIYLRARSTDAIGRGRPQKKEAKPASFTEAETACMG
ncbi:c-type cytochrome, methanol metabolism-related [Nordella sp. HKS 07]|uniref:c-type cytochrome, methanol metabolism-related n=1 Tax=Nordella sp. HKS 07 TaxID=2712222 RepID=UPI0013E18722|nr:c-type cytochrome, methanol metabolism-related [Nordella sp. HKS 07]QIG48408.1 c-type cytochrome, methanol metabolism-related [Nordella sp. HKS 07]